MPLSVDPKRDFAVEVVRRLQEAGFCALWAGGCVRDVLMGRIPKDYDVATDARPDTVRELFGRRRTLAVGASFGVIVVLGPKKAGNVEVATFRTEGPYVDGRRPEHVVFSTPENDALRRDFTINGMFYDPVADRIDDYVGGQRDLAGRVVRAIGNPADRMAEDKLRMLRAVRFAATLDFALDPDTGEAVHERAGEIRMVSAERITQELRAMLIDSHRRRAMELANELGLLAEILPELPAAPGPPLPGDRDSAWAHTLARLAFLKEPSFELAAAALLLAVEKVLGVEQAGSTGPIAKRLRMSNEETAAIGWLVQNVPLVQASQSLSRAQLKRLLAHPRARDLLELARAEAGASGGDPVPVDFCEGFLRRTPPHELDPGPLVSGNDLIAMGLSPGKLFRQILDAVRDAQLNEEISTRDEALERVRKFIQQNGSH